MTPQDRRLERLLKLLATLLDTSSPLSRAQITERVPMYPAADDAERQAFARDLRALQTMGVPVEVTEGNPPGYRVPPEAYRLPDPGLSEEEQAALHLALATVGLDLAEGSAEEALWKVAGGAPQTIEAPAATAALPGHDHLAAIWRAVNDRRRIRFTYKGEARRVEPWGLSCRRGHWYLEAFDTERGGERRFRLDRIEGAPTVDIDAGAFDRPEARPAGGPPPAWQMGDEVRYVAEVEVDAAQAALVRTMRGITVAAERSDGTVVVETPVADEEFFLAFVFSLLDHATVIGPPEARRAVVDRLEALASAGATS